MTVKKAKQIAARWVFEEAINIPGFSGAFYHGSIQWLSEEDSLSPSSDVDLMIVLSVPFSSSPGKFMYDNLLLEVSFISSEELRSAEQVAGNYYLAGSFRKPNIILDPSGRQTGLQQEVAEKYPMRCWVHRRCEGARDNVLRFLTSLRETDPVHDQVTSWLFARGVMTHILLVAGLKNATVRKRYADTQKLLAADHSLDFYEQLLEQAGFAGMSRPEVEAHLTTLTEVFDIAASVIKKPYRFAADISKIARPVVIEGSHELINAGFHREAMFWIVATHCRCQHVLLQNATAKTQKKYSGAFQELLTALKITTYKDRQQSNYRIRNFMPSVWNMAEIIIDKTPFIKP